MYNFTTENIKKKKVKDRNKKKDENKKKERKKYKKKEIIKKKKDESKRKKAKPGKTLLRLCSKSKGFEGGNIGKKNTSNF